MYVGIIYLPFGLHQGANGSTQAPMQHGLPQAGKR